MPRRNQRENYVPLDLTVRPSDLRKRDEAAGLRRRDERIAKLEHQAECRARKGIDWNICVVPGCGRNSILKPWWSTDPVPRDRRHHFLDVAICFDHALVVFDRMANNANDPNIIEALATLHTLKAERAEANRREAAAKFNDSHDGDIYFVQVGSLVKVGWTKRLWDRVKEYGAAAELLAHYPGTRSDETHLHRNLRPALAKGREWYNDGPIVRRYIDEAIEKHGPPLNLELWTVPKVKP